MNYSPNIIRVIKAGRIRWVRNVTRMMEKRNGYRIVVEKHEKDRPINRLRHRWNNNIKIDLTEIGQQGVRCIHLAGDRDKWFTLVTTVMVPMV